MKRQNFLALSLLPVFARLPFGSPEAEEPVAPVEPPDGYEWMTYSTFEGCSSVSTTATTLVPVRR